MAARIAIVGDRDANNPNHRGTESALHHSGAALGVRVETTWFPTDALLDDSACRDLVGRDGIWCTTGSPYRSLDGALRAIRLAREGGIPFLATCGGFQHAVLEFARNVAGLADAEHGEYEGSPADALIAALDCSLVGKWFEVEMRSDCRAASCYGSTSARERYFCSYGINPRWQQDLLDRGLPVVGSDDAGAPRILEMPEHPFFIATLFVPQARSTSDEPHPLVSGFVRAASGRS